MASTPPPSPAARRALTPAHLRFYRAVIEGVLPAKAWAQYLPIEDDYSEAHARDLMGWLRHALVAEALAAGRPELIGLFRRDPQRIAASGLPTLAEFAERFADAGEFSQHELTAMWHDAFGSRATAEARRERLTLRLREAIALLQRATQRSPNPADAVSLWLPPNLAQRLADAGLRTLADLRASLAARRSPRWPAVPGVGAVWADRLRDWLAEHDIAAPPAAPGVALSVSPLRSPSADEVLTPLIALPAAAPPPAAALTPGNPLGAVDDRQAVALWLAARAVNPHTLRAYRRVAERLLLWCEKERRIGLRQMTVADCIHYRQWLSTLGRQSPEQWAAAGWRIPAQQWLGKRAARRNSSDWRPFDAALSARSLAQDLLIVKALFGFLLGGGYLAHQPWDLVGKTALIAPRLADAGEQFVERSLEPAQWALAVGALDGRRGDRAARLRAVLWLGYACGLRAAEMLSLSLGSLQPRAGGWRLRVLGKGGKARTVPLPSPARDAVLDYLASIGIATDAVLRFEAADAALAGQPLLRAQRGRRGPGRALPSAPLGYTTLYTDLKRHFAECADRIATDNALGAVKFRQASTHWLRHTCATLALRSGVPLNAVQRVLGHASLQTTSHYLTEQQQVLQQAMERFAAGNG